MADLLTCDLNTLSFHDVDEYLGFSQPEDQRLPESSRIDYKEDFPQDLGDNVAALANTYGGLIVLGVKSDKKKGNIPIEWRGVQLGPDPSARISARILSTVRPRPLFDIGLAQSSNGHVVVIRVNEGDYPPYEYEQGNTVKISLRINDVKRPASVRDIEALMERRALKTESATNILATIEPHTFYPHKTESLPGGGSKVVHNARVHAMVIAPHRPLKLRLDVIFERQFERWIKSSFPDAKSFSRNFRSGTFYEVREIRSGPNELHRVWRISSSGALGFVRNIDLHGHPGEPIGDVATDLLFFFRFARLMLEASGNFGRSTFVDMLCAPSTSFLSRFPEPDGVHGYDDISGVHFPPARPEVLPSEPRWENAVEFHEFEKPIELTTSVLFDQLRASWGASIHYEKLQEAVAALDRQSQVPNWGRI